jgi:tetratricopeptide (TPR) repeat protein
MKKILLFSFVLLTTFWATAQDEAQKAFSEGVKLLKANQFAAAERQFSVAIEKGVAPNGLKMSYIYKGFSLNGQEKYSEAILCFDKSIQIDPLDPATYTDRGITYSYKKDYAKAILDFEKVLTMDSTGKQAEAAYYYLGRIKSLQLKLDEAIAYLDKLLILVPTDAEAYFLRGTAKSNMMNIKGSIADFDLAIKYNPEYMEAYANRGFQKINALPVAEKTYIKDKCLPDPCADFKKAKALGDTLVDDMLFLYCSGCK